MPHRSPTDPSPDAEGAEREDESAPIRSPVPGRGRPLVEVSLRHLKSSWALKACAVMAFTAYGGLIALLLAGKLTFKDAAVVACLSLASWFFLFWWFPVIERTIQVLGESPRRRAIGRTLETIAVGCVVLVHVLMAWIVIHAARS